MGVERPPPSNEAGFSLVEVIIAIGLFSLIALAGFTLVSTVLSVQERTDGRLERLGALQRALHLMTSDLQQLTAGGLRLGEGRISFDRAHARSGRFSVSYEVTAGKLYRVISGESAGRRQLLAEGVESATWSVLVPSLGRFDAWPVAESDDLSPHAVTIELNLDSGMVGLEGQLRRTVLIPRITL